MTKATFTINTANKIIGFECSGHAGFALPGKKDICCAAISALTITAVNSIEKLSDVRFKLEENSDSGNIKCILIEEPNEITETIFRSLEIGLRGISESYGSKFCKVIFKED